FSQIADGYDDMLADLSYGVVFALDQPDSINWYLCPIDFQTATNEVAFQYFYYCGDTLALENVRREETQLIDSKTGQKKIGLRYFFSKGKLYYSDKGNWILSTHTSEVGEWGGSVMLAWQQDGENLTLKGISNVIPFHGNYGKISLETVREVSDNSLVIVAKTKAGSDGGGAVQPWVGLWTMPYQMELIYSYVDRISYE
ncbi:MAG: hypothetical protein AAFP70_11025, partial [Calditrichota bacterium]